jgi:sodium/hydrogen antiporter
MLGSDDLLAAFACGSAFAWDGFFNRQTEESVFSSVIDLLFNVGAFVYVGAWMPFRSFQNPETTLSVWRLVVIAILVFLLKRLPIMVALFKWIPDIKTFREALFSGHFGPIGIGAHLP